MVALRAQDPEEGYGVHDGEGRVLLAEALVEHQVQQVGVTRSKEVSAVVQCEVQNRLVLGILRK